MLSEEAKVLELENSPDVLTAFNKIPYSLINAEIGVEVSRDTLWELTEICKYYKAYKKGVDFYTEGTNGDYIPANLRYKMAATLIDKEARFLFAEPPDIKVEPKGDVGKASEGAKNAITVFQDLLDTVLEKNMFEDKLIKAARDCFIGKRVAAMINFNEEDGITVSFLNSTQFIFETKMANPSVLTKFVAFLVIQESRELKSKIIFKKKFELDEESGKVYLEEATYSGTGALIEVITEYQETLLDVIPACVFLNDGLTGDEDGESEIEMLADYEKFYSKLGNADIDAGRKSMNPTKYTVDMESASTRGLSTAPGAVWHLGTDQNLDHPAPSTGILEPSMNYSEPLKTTLDRIKTAGYEAVDMPNITLETMTGAITSGKALKAVYWPLIVRCKEKMKVWGPQLKRMAEIIIEGAKVYPLTAARYINDPLEMVAYEIKVEPNLPLPEDEVEERTMDLAEVEALTMSKKTYMKKWRNLTDDEVEEELYQMAMERQILEDAAFSGDGTEEPYPEEGEEDTEDDYEDDPNELDDEPDDVADDMALDDMLQGALDELSML